MELGWVHDIHIAAIVRHILQVLFGYITLKVMIAHDQNCVLGHLRSLDLDRLLFGDRDRLVHLLPELASSFALCSNSFRLLEPMPEGVPVPLDVPDMVAETNSTASLGLFDFSCSFALAKRFWEALSSST